MTNETSIRFNNHWIKNYAKLDYWTPEEAVSLACNLNPQYKRETVHILKVAGDDVPLMVLLTRAIECLTIKVEDNKIKPLDFIKWCKSKDIPFPRKIEAVVGKFHVSEAEDLKTELEKAKNIINELEEQLNKKSQEDDLDTKTKNGYDRAIATIAVALWSDNSKIDENLNAHNIIKKCDVRNSNFNYIKDEQTLRKYIGPARERLGLPHVYQK